MVWLISALMAVSMTACSNTQKKDTKDQAQITTAAKENETQTEAAKTTSKKRKEELVRMVPVVFTSAAAGILTWLLCRDEAEKPIGSVLPHHGGWFK